MQTQKRSIRQARHDTFDEYHAELPRHGRERQGRFRNLHLRRFLQSDAASVAKAGDRIAGAAGDDVVTALDVEGCRRQVTSEIPGGCDDLESRR